MKRIFSLFLIFVLLILTACESREEVVLSATIAVEIKQYSQISDVRTVDFEYLEVIGLTDTGVAQRLNEELEAFCIRVSSNAEYNDKNITGTVEYAVVGYTYLSVRVNTSVFADGMAYPNNDFYAGTFDLRTGKIINNISAFVEVGDDLQLTIETGVFKQIYPETIIDYAVEVLADEFDKDINFYLTKDGIGLFLTGRSHAEGSYWIFEATYGDINKLLTHELLLMI